ncbi:hypothetical protein C2845_PM11G17540 [Panicum miliaceum]|uniref:Uncharacterized protein n=1 Tax=Panicum miliaceum TaxID=4540 RepID=A0A3L6RY73_PANMI|nr:hypothetical protein C2845_PM11G17540 [Panicum miliaceum]
MRTKRLVTFKMRNKRQANKGKKDDSPTGDWERIGGCGIQFKQGKGKEYIYYSLPTNHSGWRSLWFYIGNNAPALPERTPGKAVWRPEWNEKLNPNQMLQVTKLLELIKEHKDAGVTGACVLPTMYKRRIMPLQKRCRFGFEYLGSNDPSRLTAYILPSQTAFTHVRRVLLDADTVPYVPKLFSAINPPKPGYVDLYRCPAPNPDVPRADHLRLSAFQVLKTHHYDPDAVTDEDLIDSDDGIHLADLLKKSGKESSSSLGMPGHPTKPRGAVRKRKLVLGGNSDENPSTVLPEVTLVTMGGVAGELPKESVAQDASVAGATHPSTNIAQSTSPTGPGAGDVGAASTSEPSTEAADDLIEDPDLSKEKRDHVLNVFKDLYKFTTEKSNKLKLLQDGHLQLQEKDCKISEEVRKNSELQKKLMRLEADRAQEASAFKNTFENLKKEKTQLIEKNKKAAKAHKEPKSTLQKKENLIIDLKNLVYRGTDDVERLERILNWRAILAGEASSDSQKVAGYIAEASKTYITQALALVKSCWPKAKLKPLAEGMAADCSVEQFTKFHEEVELIADKIAESLEQDG